MVLRVTSLVYANGMAGQGLPISLPQSSFPQALNSVQPLRVTLVAVSPCAALIVIG